MQKPLENKESADLAVARSQNHLVLTKLSSQRRKSCLTFEQVVERAARRHHLTALAMPEPPELGRLAGKRVG